MDAMRALLHTLMIGMATTSANPVPSAAAPTALAATVEAGGQRCIASTFVRQVKGVYDSSYVEYANRCGQSVGFFWCQYEQYQRGSTAPCDPKLGTFNTTVASVGWINRVSSSARAQLFISIRECPSGYRPSRTVDGHFYCTK